MHVGIFGFDLDVGRMMQPQRFLISYTTLTKHVLHFKNYVLEISTHEAEQKIFLTNYYIKQY